MEGIPDEILSATNKAHSALSWANTVRHLIDDTVLSLKQEWHDKDAWRSDLANQGREGASALSSLLDAVQAFELEASDSLFFEFANAFEIRHQIGGRLYTSYHFAAHEISNSILTNVWRRTDREGFFGVPGGKRVFDVGKISAGWVDGCKDTGLGAMRNIPAVDESLFVLLSNEGARAAERRPKGQVVTPPEVLAFRIGERKYQVGKQAALTLPESEDFVLRSLIDLGGTADKSQLATQTGKDDAPRILKSICTKFPTLAEFIFLPGGKGKGGYRTTIRSKSATIAP